MAMSFIRKEVIESPAYPAPHDTGEIKLDQNESPWDMPASLRMKIVERFLNQAWNRYPAAEPILLKKQLAAYLGVWPDNVVIANGSNVLVQALLMAIAIRRKVVTLKPSFVLYALQSRLLANQVLEVPLAEDFTLDTEQVLATLTKANPQLVFIANPNAPTGTLFPRDDLIEIVKRAPCPVVIDEAYYPFSAATLVDQVKQYPRLIILRTFSKAFAMAGVRLGYMVADVDIAQQIAKVLLPFCVSSLAQIMAELALEDPSWMQDYVNRSIAERESLYKKMNMLSGIEPFPSQANFILFRVQNAKECFRKLLGHDVLVRDVSDTDRLLNCLRVTIGSPEENGRFFDALQKVLR